LPPRNSLLQSALDRVEREIRDLAVEYAFAFSAEGDRLLG
jgi:hypothetical protein